MPVSANFLRNPRELKKLAVTILCKWPDDGLFYLVDVIEHNQATNKCQVKYEDGVVQWVAPQDLHAQLKESINLDNEKIICCICNGGDSSLPNEIIICDSCQQGYHLQSCHKPPVERVEAKLDDEDAEWRCATCLDLDRQANVANVKVKDKRRSLPVSTPKARSRDSKLQVKSEMKSKSRASTKFSPKENKIRKPSPKSKVTRNKGTEKDSSPPEQRLAVVLSESSLNNANYPAQTNGVLVEPTISEEMIETEIVDKSAVLESEPQEILKLAKKLAEAPDSVISTPDFLDMVTGHTPANDDKTTKTEPKVSKMETKVTKDESNQPNTIVDKSKSADALALSNEPPVKEFRTKASRKMTAKIITSAA